jgi:glycine betaine/proline transport system substrate-binding protein
MVMKSVANAVLVCLASALTLPSYAQDPQSCRAVRFADIGWTDITSTTALAAAVFEGLGYEPKVTIASVPISFAGLKNKQIDVSLGYWWPVQEQALAPFVQAKAIQVLEPPNLSGAKATLAVPSYAYDTRVGAARRDATVPDARLPPFLSHPGRGP